MGKRTYVRADCKRNAGCDLLLELLDLVVEQLARALVFRCRRRLAREILDPVSECCGECPMGSPVATGNP